MMLLRTVLIALLVVVVASEVSFVTEEENVVIRRLIPAKPRSGYNATEPSNGCQCIHEEYDCGCCVHMEIDQIDLNDTGCVNVTYLPDQYGISLTFSLDGKVLINETVSAKNPPPICFAVPYLHNLLSLCIDFYNLDIQGPVFSGCIKLEASIVYMFHEDFDLGCFKIGAGYRTGRAWAVDHRAQKQWLQDLVWMQQKQRLKMKIK